MSIIKRLGNVAKGKGKGLVDDAREALENLGDSLTNAFEPGEEGGASREEVLDRELARGPERRRPVDTETDKKLAILDKLKAGGMLTDEEYLTKRRGLLGDEADPDEVAADSGSSHVIGYDALSGNPIYAEGKEPKRAAAKRDSGPEPEAEGYDALAMRRRKL